MTRRGPRKSDPQPRELASIEPQQGRDQVEGGIANGIDPRRKMIEDHPGKQDVGNAKGQRQQQNRQEDVCPSLPHTFIIEQQHNEHTLDDAPVDEHLEKKTKKCFQADGPSIVQI